MAASGSVAAASLGQSRPLARPIHRPLPPAVRGLRVRLPGGDHTEVRYDSSDADPDALIEHVVAALAHDTGALRTRPGAGLSCSTVAASRHWRSRRAARSYDRRGPEGCRHGHPLAEAR